MVEIDKITQHTAANAEQSASASEELNAQADNLEDFVDNLVALIGGSSSASRTVETAQQGSQPSKSGDVFDERVEMMPKQAKALPHPRASSEDEFEEF